jgi:hypothetical protein
VITVAVRWYLRYGLSYRDVEELLGERRITVDHVTVYRWVQRFAAEFIEAARPCRRLPGGRWFVDEVRHEALWIRGGVRDLHRRVMGMPNQICRSREVGARFDTLRRFHNLPDACGIGERAVYQHNGRLLVVHGLLPVASNVSGLMTSASSR